MPMKKMILFVVGAALIVAGVAWTLKEWIFLKMVFSAVIGPLMAVIGFVIITMARE